MELDDLKKIEERMPHNIESEKAVIGCLLQDNSTIEEVFATITSEMFYSKPLQAVFKSIGELRKAGIEVDKITAKDYAIPILNSDFESNVKNIKQRTRERDGYGEETLNDQFFIDIMQNAAFETSVMSYCNIIKDKYYLRKSIDIAAGIIENCRRSDKRAEEICIEAQDSFFKLTSNSNNKIYQKAEEFIKPIFNQLDSITAGLQNSDMIVLAARPGQGKTTFALNLAYNICARENKSVLFFSLEMNGIQLVKRVLSSLSFVSSQNMRTGKLSDKEMTQLIDSSYEIENKKLFICDNPVLTIADLRNKCQKVKNKEGLDVVFIDYLQLMVPGDNYKTGNKGGFMSRQEEVSAISRNIKALAKELNILQEFY